MKSEFTFSDSFKNSFDGRRVWISPYKEDGTPDLPVLDLGMGITMSCRITCCLAGDEDKPQNWKNTPVRVCGIICERRVAIDSRGQSHMIYTVAPNVMETEDIRRAMDKVLD